MSNTTIGNQIHRQAGTWALGLFLFVGAVTLPQSTVAASAPQRGPAPSSAADPLYDRDRAAAQAPFDAVSFARVFRHQTTSVNGVQMHYVIGGRGPAVLLLHGWPETWYAWRRVMPALAEHHTVIAVDMPGFGDSSAARAADKKTVAEILHGLMAQLGVSSVSPIGHDMGGPVAYAYAAAYPLEVRKLVLMEMAVPGFGFADGSARDILKLTSQSVLGVWHFPFFMNTEMADLLIRGHEREFVSAMAKPSYYNPAAFGEDELNELTAWLTKPGGIRGGTSYYAALFDDARQNQQVYGKTKLTMPVLVMTGDFGFLKNVTEGSVRQVATSVRSIVVPKSGHFIAEERPLLLAQQLSLFLDAAK